MIDLSTVDESDHGVVFSLQFSGSSKRRGAVGRTNSKTKSSGGEASLMTSHGVVGAQTTSEAPEKSEVFFTCESLELYHLVLDGFGMILEHAEAAVSEPNNTEVSGWLLLLLVNNGVSVDVSLPKKRKEDTHQCPRDSIWKEVMLIMMMMMVAVVNSLISIRYEMPIFLNAL